LRIHKNEKTKITGANHHGWIHCRNKGRNGLNAFPLVGRFNKFVKEITEPVDTILVGRKLAE